MEINNKNFAVLTQRLNLLFSESGKSIYTLSEESERISKEKRYAEKGLFGFDRTSLKKYLNGDVKNLRMTSLIVLADTFNVSLDYLCGLSDNRHSTDIRADILFAQLYNAANDLNFNLECSETGEIKFTSHNKHLCTVLSQMNRQASAEERKAIAEETLKNAIVYNGNVVDINDDEYFEALAEAWDCVNADACLRWATNPLNDFDFDDEKLIPPPDPCSTCGRKGKASEKCKNYKNLIIAAGGQRKWSEYQYEKGETERLLKLEREHIADIEEYQELMY
jgi:hypothetical protein